MEKNWTIGLNRHKFITRQSVLCVSRSEVITGNSVVVGWRPVGVPHSLSPISHHGTETNPIRFHFNASQDRLGCLNRFFQDLGRLKTQKNSQLNRIRMIDRIEKNSE